MRIFFLFLHTGYIRNFESTLRMLAERGHEIQIAFSAVKREDFGGGVPERLPQEYPNLTCIQQAVPTRKDMWEPLSNLVRMGIDSARYLLSTYANAPKLRRRVSQRAPRFVQMLFQLSWLNLDLPVKGFIKFAQTVLAAIPSSPHIERFLQSHSPDLVLVTPLTNFASDQVEYLKSAQALGMRTGLCVTSWDNLTNKGLIRIQPDVVTVWNEAQKLEAVEMHGIPPDKVVVTGAQCFDYLFERKPSTTREEFCAKAGLDPAKPFLLYLCSSPFIGSRVEVDFVKKWADKVRESSEPGLAEAGILVRPHPQTIKQWNNVRFPSHKNIVVYPRTDVNPIDEDRKTLFHDSLFHSAAVVGVNTTALIEAGIVGRAVCTMLAPEFEDTQKGTLHFHHLLQVGGGLLQCAESFEQHMEQLSSVLSSDEVLRRTRRPFIESFVRPQGIQTPSTPILVDAIERQGKIPAARTFGRRMSLLLIRALLVLFAGPFLVLIWAGKEGKRTIPRIQRWISSQGAAGKRLNALGRYLRASLPRSRNAKWGPGQFGPHGWRRFIGGRRWAGSNGIHSHSEVSYIEVVRREVSRIVGSGNLIVAGPWTGSIAGELFFWIPFLRWVKEYHQLPDDQLRVISRGGVESWYRDVSSQYTDVFDIVTFDEFLSKRLREEEILQRQRGAAEISYFDTKIITQWAKAGGVRGSQVLHPSILSSLLMPFWQKDPIWVPTLRQLKKVMSFRQLSVPEEDMPELKLPETFVAVKICFHPGFPDTPANQDGSREMLRQLSARQPVVLLNTGLPFAEYEMPNGGDSENICSVPHLVTPRNSLGIQSRVIGRSQNFVGTHRGFMLLASLYGVDAMTLYSQERWSAPHLPIGNDGFSGEDFGSHSVVSTHQADLIRALFANEAGSLPRLN